MRLYLERGDDGVLVGDGDGLVDALCGVADVDKESHTQQQLVVDALLEIDRLLTDHLTSKQSATRRRRGITCGVEEVASDE